MKTITESDIETVKNELSIKRKEFENLDFSYLEDKLKWIRDYFNDYVPKLEKRFLTDEEIEDWIFLPNELRIYFYLYFPEHGLNMANNCENLEFILAQQKQRIRRFDFLHDD